MITPKVYLLASLALYQVKFGLSPTRSVNWLCRIFNHDPVIPVNWDVVLVVLDQVRLTTSCHIHLEPIMSLVLTLVSSGKTSQLPTGLLVSTALQSLSFPAVLGLEGTVKKAELVIVLQT